MEVEAKSVNVQVAVRCRPVNAEERRTQQATSVICDGSKKEISVSSGPAGKKTSKTFTFDKVFGMYSTQEEVFETMVRPIIDEVLAGFNCTIFAYGQTGTGKTHTMEGDINSEADAGIVPRSVKTILETLEGSGSEFTIRVSFLELYNEELQDLLVPPSAVMADKKLKLCEDVKKGVVCQNLEEVTVMNVSDIFDILQRGIKQRATAATLCNKNSSRSHSIFTMKIMIKESSVDGEEVVRHGQLNLVDLAGSECVGRSGAKNDRAKEAGSINQSLLTLGRVITALVDHHGHIPYRDSKLTRLLQESLGGKAKTCIIATLSPAAMNVEESLSTLDYAHRAKNIKNAPQLNQRMTKRVVLKEYCQEIETLRSQLQLTREKNGVYVDPNEYYAMEARIASQESQLLDCESALRSSVEQVKNLRSEKDDLGSQLGETQRTLGATTSQLNAAEATLQQAERELAHAKVELGATEAVVVEQSSTETRLSALGQQLLSEVALRRSERDALLGKVDRLVSKEQERLASAAEFVGLVAADKESLASGVSAVLAANQQQSAALCEGVMQMLHRGKDTCATLKASIDGALGALMQDADAAKGNMTASCGELQQHLRGTSDHLAQTLQSMGAELSAWLGEVDSGIKSAVQELAQQQQQIHAASQMLSEQADSLVSLAGRYAAQEAEASAKAVVAANDFQRDLEARLEQHQQAVAESAERARESVATKAAAMQKAMQSLLQDLVGDTSSDLSSVAASSATLCRDASALSKSHQTASLALHCSAVENANAHAEQLKTMSSTAHGAASTAMQALSQTAATASSQLHCISSTVEGKRHHLDSTVAAVCCESASALTEHACSRVEANAEAARTILEQVQGAAGAMSSTAGDAMTSFGQFLDTTGADVCSGVNVHFSDLDQHLAAQAGGLDALAVRVEQFGVEAAGAVVSPTGTTPQKLPSGYPFALPAELAATRAHEAIKAEARGRGDDCVSAAPFSVDAPTDEALVAVVAEAIPLEAKMEIAAPAPPTSSSSQQTKENAAPNAERACRPSGLTKGLGRSKSASDGNAVGAAPTKKMREEGGCSDRARATSASSVPLQSVENK